MTKLISFSIFILSAFHLLAQVDFDTHFKDKTFRFDYIIAGTADKYDVFFEQMKEEPFWGGSKINLIDTFNLGDFKLLIYNEAGDSLLYSRGFSTLFYEWLDTDEAKTTKRSFYESVVFPFPKHKVLLKIQVREKNTKFRDLYEYEIDPKNIFIKKDKQLAFSTQKIHYSGEHHTKLDIVIIPDGYTAEEMTKFHKDCKRFADYFFKVEPFKSHKDKVNFWAVDAVSEESGTDVPGDTIWKNTILDTHFYTFGIPRYLTCPNVKQLRDIAAYVPYDQIYILVNSDIYGGGGIYNYYNLCTADHRAAEPVFTHEFGHAFAALADEYQYGYDKAEDIYDMTAEPWQVNITNLVDFDSKWKNLVDKDTPVPTPLSPDNQKYKDKIGAFEGAGYVKKGIYRPTDKCKMRTNKTNEFCPVCYKAVYNLLLFYTN